jgi:superfamily II DNA/RNA helicase
LNHLASSVHPRRPDRIGLHRATAVQSQAIPAAIEGRDLLVSSQTGSGKTAAFMLPSLHKLASAEQRRRQDAPGNASIARPRRASTLQGSPAKNAGADADDRELALQVTTNTDKYSTHPPHQGRVDPGRHALPETDAIAGQES